MYRYLEHEADIGIEGIGISLEEAFTEGAKAMFNVMCEINTVKSKVPVKLFCSARDIETLFVEFLNELLGKAGIENMLFSKFEITIMNSRGHLELLGKAYGEKLDQNKHGIKTEVKAATYSGLRVKKRDTKYYVRCVLDI